MEAREVAREAEVTAFKLAIEAKVQGLQNELASLRCQMASLSAPVAAAPAPVQKEAADGQVGARLVRLRQLHRLLEQARRLTLPPLWRPFNQLL